jgi:hypothetical protein
MPSGTHLIRLHHRFDATTEGVLWPSWAWRPVAEKAAAEAAARAPNVMLDLSRPRAPELLMPMDGISPARYAPDDRWIPSG